MTSKPGLQECRQCHEPMRNRATGAAAAFPDVKKWLLKDGLCYHCWHAARAERNRAALRRCGRCDCLTRPRGTTAADHPGTRLFGGRGMCSTCYHHHWRRQDGSKPRAWNRSGDVLDEYAFLTTDTAVTRRGIAAQLGITPNALDMHLSAARKAGDPRAARRVPL